MRRFIATLIAITVLMATRAQQYHDMTEYPLLGTLAPEASRPFTRLPDSLEGQVRGALWSLGQNTAGLSVRFATDATTITVKWTVMNKTSMNHMCPTGIRGLDLYALLPDDTWAFVGSAIPSSNRESTATVAKGLPKQMREYMLFLPLYDGVEQLYVGVNNGATMTAPSVALPVNAKPVVMYGTSILQGGCASRPGMAHTNILQRLLNREVINLGFSGNGHLDPEIAHLMATADAGAYVIDVLPNNTVASIKEKLEPFYKILRQDHPTTPIVLVESPTYSRTLFDEGYHRGTIALNRTLRQFYEEHIRQGDINLYCFDSTDILDNDMEGTVDGIHFTDLGFQHFASQLYPLLDTLLY